MVEVVYNLQELHKNLDNIVKMSMVEPQALKLQVDNDIINIQLDKKKKNTAELFKHPGVDDPDINFENDKSIIGRAHEINWEEEFAD
ncbi:MAG: hypothetical protein Ta2D_02440 [Rickettsiales bacterium]|nr:MAG: hypothetical protein Ta2D_02440 [Rickettsiales bacterium]